ncbi:hypothetical protein PH505_bb00520 [Pseudoalteromonas distincta]|uniref:hypothetical protein n=1 Tax=Pseudoalteromonas distincta TaxID=77608 RepID=UPI00020A0FDB|nr:hypothetical protein [Pseudoalteromonas distincta]EGI72904.1 hypothetical protein PH505_bb00520 [Pseudoalteromonas distincta]
MQQVISKDYDRLYDLVCKHGFDVPCRLNYSFRDDEYVLIDRAVVKNKPDGICVSVGGCTYLSADEFQVSISFVFNTVKDMFKSDCHKSNLEWFDTFTNN